MSTLTILPSTVLVPSTPQGHGSPTAVQSMSDSIEDDDDIDAIGDIITIDEMSSSAPLIPDVIEEESSSLASAVGDMIDDEKSSSSVVVSVDLVENAPSLVTAAAPESITHSDALIVPSAESAVVSSSLSH